VLLAVKLLAVPDELVQAARTVIANAVGERPCVFLAGHYRAERLIAEKLISLVAGPLPWQSIDPDKALPWMEQRTSLR
jgi:exodeoxyribonuclease V alpha subunit